MEISTPARSGGVSNKQPERGQAALGKGRGSAAAQIPVTWLAWVQENSYAGSVRESQGLGRRATEFPAIMSFFRHHWDFPYLAVCLESGNTGLKPT